MERLAIGSAVVAMALAIALVPGARIRTVGSGRVVVAAARATTHHHATSSPSHHVRSTTTSHHSHTVVHRRSHAVIAVFSQSYLARSERAGRLHNIRIALHLVKHHPLGTGLGTFGSSGSKAFGSNLKGIPKNFYADDNYIVVLVETGFLGTLAFLALGLSIFDRLRKSNAPLRNRQLAGVLFLSLIVMSFTDDAMEQLNLTIYPWLAMTILVAGEEVASSLLGKRRATEDSAAAKPA
jgi:hypothetical protein